MSTNNSYFGKVILFITLSIASFFLIKEVFPARLFSEQAQASNSNMVIDSMLLDAVNESEATDHITNKSGTETSENEVKEFDANLNPSIAVDGYQNMSRFYAKLYQLEKDPSKKVRVAYFGDSMNDGDYIVQDVRSEMQDKYGGSGVGFVAITSLSAGARGSISHQFSKDWKTQSFVNVKKPTRPFGVDGQVFFTKNGGSGQWVKYKAQSQRNATELNSPTLFYGSANNPHSFVRISADKDSASTKTLSPTKLLNTLPLVSRNAKSVQVEFHKADSIPFYGINFDNGQGVHVDNFSIRGNSGLPLSILNPGLMNAFDQILNYDLIILHYGTNVLNYGSLNYSWYEKNMTTVVNNLHKCFPNADILIISTADKASKIDMVMQTDSAVVPLANAQKSYARKTGSAFINLYELMGGSGSMVKWVNDKLAGKDYTHFNASGSKKIAKLIYGEIDKGYIKYKARNRED